MVDGDFDSRVRVTTATIIVVIVIFIFMDFILFFLIISIRGSCRFLSLGRAIGDFRAI